MNLFLSPLEKLDRFNNYLKLFKNNPTFAESLYDYFKIRLKVYVTEYDLGTLESHSDDEWSDINLRGGILAVEGTECEMIAAMYLISTGCNIKMIDTKDNQVSGIDFMITKPVWKLPYSVSVKKRPIRENSLVLYKSDFPSNVVDRVAFVDPISGFVMQGPYSYFKAVYDNRSDKTVASVRVSLYNLTDSKITKIQNINSLFEGIHK